MSATKPNQNRRRHEGDHDRTHRHHLLNLRRRLDGLSGQTRTERTRVLPVVLTPGSDPMSRLRETRRIWPTHRGKQRGRTTRPEPEPQPITTDQMVAALVARGLASRWVIEHPRPSDNHQQDAPQQEGAA